MSLTLLASFYDREEAQVARTALDSAGLFVVLNGVDRMIGMPELRGAAPLALYGLDHEREAALALLTWRAPEARDAPVVAFFSAPVKSQLWVAITLLIGLFGGVPFMIGWPRQQGDEP